MPPLKTPHELHIRLIPEFLQWLQVQGFAKKTLVNYLSDVQQLATWLEETTQTSLLSLQTSDLEEFISARAATGLSPATQRRHQASFRKFAEFLEQHRQYAPQFQVPAAVKTPSEPKSAWKYVRQEFQLALARVERKESVRQSLLTELELFVSTFPNTQLSEIITKPKLAEYLAELHGDDAPQRRRYTERVVQLLAAWAAKKELLNENPFATPLQKSWNRFQDKWIPLSTLQFASLWLLSSSQHTQPLPDSLAKNPFMYWYWRYHRWSASTYLHAAVLVIFAVMIGIVGYQQLYRDAGFGLAYPTSPVTPQRILSFQGRLTDSSRTPITSATSVTFRLFDVDTGGTDLWENVCTITPDQDGVFSIRLGDTSNLDCTGGAIGAGIFSENDEIWLEIEVASETLTPRQQIATVAYSLNSETLQGFPVSTTGDANTIPLINNSGELVIGTVTPKITASNGAFTIQGESIVFEAETGAAGGFTFQPDGEGMVQVLSETSSTDSFQISNSNLNGFSLITGEVGNNNASYLLTLAAGSVLDTKFLVDTLGNTTIDGFLQAPGATLSASYAGSTPLTIRSLTPHTANLTNWRDASNTTISSVQSDGSLTIGGATTSARLEVRSMYANQDVFLLKARDGSRLSRVTETAGGTALFELDDAAGTPQVYFRTDGSASYVLAGNFGVGTTGPDAKLDVLSTTEQFRTTYTDGSVYTSYTTDSSGNLTINNTGTKTVLAEDLQVSGNDILDGGNSTRISLGATTTFFNTTTTLSGTTALTAASLTDFTTSAALDMGATTSLTLGDDATLYGSDTANGDLTINGTSNATITSSYVILQSAGGNVGIGTNTPTLELDVNGEIRANTVYSHKDRWDTNPADAPDTIGSGGTGVYDGSNSLYVVRGGGTTTFYRYDQSSNAWSTLTAAPATISTGGTSVYTGGDFIYVLRGGSTTDFYRYSISGDSWSSMTVAPGNIGTGAGLVYTGGDYIYTAAGGTTTTFYRYSISGDSWTTLTAIPGTVGNSGGMAYTGGNYLYLLRGGSNSDFYRYDIDGDSWSSLSTTPSTVGTGSSLTYTGGNYLYAFRGASSATFWRYSLATDEWITLAAAPGTTGIGATLIPTGGRYMYALRGGSTTTLWRYEGVSDLGFTYTALGITGGGPSSGAGWEYDAATQTIYPVDANADVVVGGASTASARFKVEGKSGAVNIGNLSLAGRTASISANHSDGTLELRSGSDASYILADSDLRINGGDILGPNGAAFISMNVGTPNTTIISGNLDVTNQGVIGVTNSALNNNISLLIGETPALDNFSTIRLNPTTTTARGWSLNAYDDGTTAQYFEIYDALNTATRLLITNAGDVGIGTSGPDAKLDVAATTQQLRTTYSDGAVYTGFTTDSSGNLTIDNTGTKTILAEDLQVSGNDILDSGNSTRISLGATTTLFNTTTTLSGTTTMTASTLASFTTAASLAMNSTTTLTLGDNATIHGSDTANGNLTLSGTSNGTKTTSYVNIQPTGGYVGIGNTAPSTIFHIDDNATLGTGILVTGGGSGGPMAKFERDVGASDVAISIHAGSANPQISLQDGVSSFMAIGLDNTTFKISASSSIGTNDRMTIDSSGNFTFSGDITDVGGGDLTIGSQDGTNEGGQLNLQGSGAFTNNMYLDRFQNMLRYVYNNAQVLSFSSTGVIDFPDTAADKLTFFSTTYGIGIEASTLTAWTASQFRIRVGGTDATAGTERLLLDAAGDIFLTGKQAFQATDSWLRLNNDGDFTTGVYTPGLLRVDGGIVTNSGSAAAPSLSHNVDTNTGIYYNNADSLFVSTGGTQRAQFSSAGLRVANDVISDGSVWIGVTSSTYRFRVDGDQSGYLVRYQNNGNATNRLGVAVGAGANNCSTTGTCVYFSALDGDGTAVGDLRSVTGTFQLFNASDARLKTDISSTSKDALDIINNLRVTDFRRIDSSGVAGPLQTGFIAQEVMEVFPDMVSQREDGYYGVAFDSLIPILTKATQQQQFQIDDLRAAMSNQANSQDTLRKQLIALIDSRVVQLVSQFGQNNTGSVALDTQFTHLPNLKTSTISASDSGTLAVQLGSDTASDGELTVTNISGQELFNVSNSGITAQNAVINSMENRYLQTESLQVTGDATVTGSLSAQSGRFAQLVAQDATISGTLHASRFAGTIDTDQVASFAARVRDIVAEQTATPPDQALEDLIANYDAIMALLDQPLQDPEDPDSDPWQSVTGDLTVTDTLFAQTLAATSPDGTHLVSLTADALTFTLPDTCDLNLNPTCGTFAIQPSGEGRITLLADLLILDSNGTVSVNGELLVAGRATIQDGVTTSNLQPLTDTDLEVQLASNSADSDSSLIVRGRDNQHVASFNADGSTQLNKIVIAAQEATAENETSISISTNATTGTAILPANSETFTIRNEQLKNNSLVYLTPTSSTQNRVIYVSSKTAENTDTSEKEGQFVVEVDSPADQDITFNWWIVEGQDL